jgi:hypothetical protein
MTGYKMEGRLSVLGGRSSFDIRHHDQTGFRNSQISPLSTECFLAHKALKIY